MTQSKTLPEKHAAKLRTLTDEAITIVRCEHVSAFTKGWLGKKLGADRTAVSQVIAQMKKDEFIRNETANAGDFQDPSNRGKYYLVRSAEDSRWVNGRSV